jgi:hypothetical protein
VVAVRSLAERTPRHDGRFTTHGEHEHNDMKVGPEWVNGRERDPTADRRQGDEVPSVKGVAFMCKGAWPRVLWVVVVRSLQEEVTRRSGNGGFGGSGSIATHLGGTRRRWCQRATQAAASGEGEGKENLNEKLLAHIQNIEQVEGVHGSYHGQAIHGH